MNKTKHLFDKNKTEYGKVYIRLSNKFIFAYMFGL